MPRRAHGRPPSVAADRRGVEVGPGHRPVHARAGQVAEAQLLVVDRAEVPGRRVDDAVDGRHTLERSAMSVEHDHVAGERVRVADDDRTTARDLDGDLLLGKRTIDELPLDPQAVSEEGVDLKGLRRLVAGLEAASQVVAARQTRLDADQLATNDRTLEVAADHDEGRGPAPLGADLRHLRDRQRLDLVVDRRVATAALEAAAGRAAGRRRRRGS